MEFPVTAVYDANILYPAPLRDLFIRIAPTGIVRARWTETIHDEWIRNVIKIDSPTPGLVCGAVKRQRKGLRNPTKTAEELLATLDSQGLTQTIARLREFVAVFAVGLAADQRRCDNVPDSNCLPLGTTHLEFLVCKTRNCG